MPIKTYKIADFVLRLESEEQIESAKNFEKFKSPDEAPDLSVLVRKVSELPEEEGTPLFKSARREAFSLGDKTRYYTSYYNYGKKQFERFAALEVRGKTARLSFDERFELRDSAVFDALNLPRFLLQKGIGLLHCSFIIYNGEAVLFTADSGVGKSTQAALWERYRGARVINGDRAAVKMKDGRLFACGAPFCGTSGISENEQAPVRAVVLLSQGRENVLSQTVHARAFRLLLGKFTYDAASRTETESAADLAYAASRDSFYMFSCLPQESAVQALWGELWKIGQ